MTLRMISRGVLSTLPIALLAWLGACGGPSETACAAEAWEGFCTLRAVTKIREAELPAPHVVLEVLYAPQQNPNYPSFTPPEYREEIQLLAAHEQLARDHLERHGAVQCRLEPPAPGSCTPGRMTLRITPFDPAQASTSTPTGPSGCAKIESQATQDQVQGQLQAAHTYPEEFRFEQGSSQLGSESSAAVQSLVAKLQAAPNVECIAVVGQTTVGESLQVANERARVVKDLLVSQGVDGSRLLTIAVTQAVYGTGSAPPPQDPNQRRVVLRVLLQR